MRVQETEIDSIHQLVVGATENVKEGNEDIREVMVMKWKQEASYSADAIHALYGCFSLVYMDKFNYLTD